MSPTVPRGHGWGGAQTRPCMVRSAAPRWAGSPVSLELRAGGRREGVWPLRQPAALLFQSSAAAELGTTHSVITSSFTLS